MRTTIDTETDAARDPLGGIDCGAAPAIGRPPMGPAPTNMPGSEPATPPAGGRRRLALGVAALTMLAASLVSSSSAHAATGPTTGAFVHSSGFCYSGMVNVTSSSTQFEYRQVHVYVNGQYYRSYGWEALSMWGPKAGNYFAGGWTSVYVEYADALGGGRFDIVGEWARFNSGDYYCSAL